MKYNRLGRTDMEVSAVALGCWAFAGDDTWGEQDEREAEEAVRAALDLGITTFDTAEGYGAGRSEEILGRALEGRREEAFIATKVSRKNLAPNDILRSCEASLRRLRTDRIDLYQIHWPSRDVPLADSVGAMERLLEEGKILAFGVSNFGKGDLSDLLAVRRPESNQVPYSLLFRAVEYEIQPLCVENDIGLLCYSPLMQGLLTGKFASPEDVPAGRRRTRHFSGDRPETRHSEPGCEEETFEAVRRVSEIARELGLSPGTLSLAWLLHQPAVSCVIAGARNPAQVEANAAAADVSLSPEVLSRLAEATEAVKAALGPNPDMWQTESRYR